MCDIDESSLNLEADIHEIPFRFTRFDQLLDHVDAVLIATPMALHAPQAIVALEAGKHVMSEVTACVSLEECWQLESAAKSSGKTYMLAENYCYGRDVTLIKEIVKRGLFGEIYYGEGEYLHDVKPLHHNADGSPTWRYYWQVGQNGNTYPTHSIGPVAQWFEALDPTDRPVSVVCLGTGRHTDPEHPHDDSTITLVQLKSGKLIRLRLDMMSNRPHHMNYYSVQGTDGVYEGSRVAGQRGHVWVGKNPPPGPVSDEHREWHPLSDFDEFLPEEWKNPPPEALKAGHGGGDYFVVRDFIEAALGMRTNPIDVYRGLEWTAVGLCSQISIAQGGVPIRLPDFRNFDERPLTLSAPG